MMFLKNVALVLVMSNGLLNLKRLWHNKVHYKYAHKSKESHL